MLHTILYLYSIQSILSTTTLNFFSSAIIGQGSSAPPTSVGAYGEAIFLAYETSDRKLDPHSVRMSANTPTHLPLLI